MRRLILEDCLFSVFFWRGFFYNGFAGSSYYETQTLDPYWLCFPQWDSVTQTKGVVAILWCRFHLRGHRGGGGKCALPRKIQSGKNIGPRGQVGVQKRGGGVGEG